MKTNLKIALRFLLAKKRSMLMSLIGIAMGVAFIVLTQAITSGFQELFVRTIIGTDGPMRVEDKLFQTNKYQPGVAEPRAVAEAIKRFPDVTGVSAVLRGNVAVQSVAREDTGQVFGINLDDHLAVSDLGKQIVLGHLDDFRATPTGVVFGSALASQLGVRPGDSVQILHAGGEMERYRVSAIYETGARDIDKVRIFMHAGEARLLLHRPHGCTYLQVGLRDITRAPEIAAQIQLAVGHQAKSWQEREQVWLGVFQFFGIMAYIVVFAIIVVAGLGMFNTLVMIVMEKTKEIAILRSMGFTRADIAFVFMMQGALVLVAGVLAGWAIGALATWGVSSVPLRVRGICASSHIMVAWMHAHYIGAAIASTVVVAVASWVPARRAARLEPAAIIRGASQ
jgi:lipoprotein-releasing system permease protein